MDVDVKIQLLLLNQRMKKTAEEITNQYYTIHSNNDTSIIVKNVKRVNKDEKIIFLNNFDEMIK